MALLTADDRQLGRLRDIACCQFLDFDARWRDHNDLTIDHRLYRIAGALVVTQRFAHGLSGRAN